MSHRKGLARWSFGAAGLATIVLGLSVTGCPDLLALLNGNNNGSMDPNSDPNDTDTKGNSGITGKFAGSTRCQQCHANTHFDWSATLHASALESLEAIGQGTNPNCVVCHVVGFGEEGGFVDRATTNDLAGVGCEACHGPAADHANNVNDEDLRPVVGVSADVCGQCHTGSHHPNFEEWSESGHAGIDEHVAEGLIEGGSVNSCGQCHSGKAFYEIVIQNGSLSEEAFAGMEVADIDGITCAVCHDPHARTGNATDPGDGRDFQLRWAETVPVVPTNTIDAATDPTRFNLCGQCHHSRGRDWTATSRGPHHSVQSNVYFGEMPTPDADDEPDPLVPSSNMKHVEAAEQCATCHLYRQDFMSEQAPAIAGHTFEVNFEGCVASGCHNSADAIQTRHETRKIAVAGRIEDIRERLGDPATWAYSSEGGPADQSGVNDNLKKIRFLIAYVEADGSSGTHNPTYVDSMLDEAERLLDEEGL